MFLDIGGKPKRRGDPWADNNFPACFIVFPKSKVATLMRSCLARHANDFGVFVALQGQADAAARGASGLSKFKKHVADGRKDKPASYPSIVAALQKFGYLPETFEALHPVGEILADAFGKVRQSLP